MTSSLGGAALQSIFITMLAVSGAAPPGIPGTAKRLEGFDRGNSFARYSPSSGIDSKLNTGRAADALGPRRAG